MTTGIEITESVVEKMCDELIHKMGGDVVRLSQRRPSKVQLGLPDRRYRLPIGAAFWFECKAPHGQLSRKQYEFLSAERTCGQLASCGGLDELLALAQSCLRWTGKSSEQICDATLEAWQSKGFRGERKTPLTRNNR